MFTVMGELIVKPKVSSHDTVSVCHIVPWVVRMFTVSVMGKVTVGQRKASGHDTVSL